MSAQSAFVWTYKFVMGTEWSDAVALGLNGAMGGVDEWAVDPLASLTGVESVTFASALVVLGYQSAVFSTFQLTQTCGQENRDYGT